MNITVQIVIQGQPDHVDAVIRQARQFLNVVEEGKRQDNNPLRPGIVRCVLRVLPPSSPDDGERAA